MANNEDRMTNDEYRKPSTINKIRSFRDLHAWQQGHALVLLIYKLTKKFPKDELFGLVSQMRRAAVSITSNIAEGFGRYSSKEKHQFYSIARGSLTELQNQLDIAKDVEYITPNEYLHAESQTGRVHQILTMLAKSSRNLIPIFVILFSLFAFAPSAQAAWYNSNYQYCRELTMTAGGNSGGVATTTTGGFALVATSTISSLKTVANGGRIQNTGSASGTTTPTDVIITNGTECNSNGGSTVLDFYFEKYVPTTGEFVLWVESADISSTSAKTVLMYYGNSSASDQSDEAGTFGALGEVAVWNLHENPGSAGAGEILDSTSNNNDGTDNGGMDSSDLINGFVDGALDFDGAAGAGGDYIDVGSNSSINSRTTVTVLGWIWADTADYYNIMFSNSADCCSGLKGYQIGLYNGNQIYWTTWDSGSSQHDVFGGTNLGTGGWDHIAGTYNGTIQRAFANGVQDGSVSWSGSIGTPASYNGTIGGTASNPAGGFNHDGRLDDIRIYNNALHAMDILTIYNNTKSSGTFWTFGSEEEESVGSSDWYNANYGYCRELTMTAGGNSGGVATTTTAGFALVATSTISSLATTLSSGRITNTTTASGTTTPVDVLVTNGTDCMDDGGTQTLDFYFEKYASTTGEFVLWVEPTDISSTTQKSVLMYYGYSGASDQSDEAGTFGALGEAAVYNLHEDPGTAGAGAILDSTSNNNDGTDNGGMATSDLINGIVDGAFNFNGSDDYIDVGNNSSINSLSRVTVMAWAEFDNAATGHEYIFSNDRDCCGSYKGYSFYVLESFPVFQIWDSSNVQHAPSAASISSNTWYHFVGTYNGTSQRLFVNGALGGFDNWTGDIGTPASFNSVIGSMGAFPGSFGVDGSIDDVRVYNRALHAMDILTIYNNTRSSSIFWGFGAEQAFAGGDGTPARKLRLLGKVRLQGVRLIGL